MIEPDRNRTKIAIVFGTRPEAIKLAPVVHQLRQSPDFEPLVLTTAQHREMLDQVLTAFNISTDVDLDLMKPNQSLDGIVGDSLRGVSDALRGHSVNALIVQGDTSTTLAAALAAFYARVPVIHVEAGLRTGNPENPFPEEMNRRLTTRLSSLHLAPTMEAASNLLSEDVPAERICITGNTAIDALSLILKQDKRTTTTTALPNIPANAKILLATIHRRESWGSGVKAVSQALRRIATHLPSLTIVFPLHRNPVVRQQVEPILESIPNVILTEPLPYPDFANLMSRSEIIVTDSGGVQEEAPFLNKPILVARSTTERPEGIAAGCARLVGTNENSIYAAAIEILSTPSEYQKMAVAPNPFGDGHAASRSVAAIRHLFGTGAKPLDFRPGKVSQDNADNSEYRSMA